MLEVCHVGAFDNVINQEINRYCVLFLSSSRTSPAFVLVSAFEPKTRRFSASFSPLRSASASPAPTDSISDERISIRQMTRPQTPSSPCIPSHRVNQLKHEETCDVAGREVASEKEFQSTMQISQSCEDLFLVSLYLPLQTILST